MATLQTIRDKAGVLVAAIIGIAILAFVLGDFLGGKNGGGFRNKKRLEIGEIAGNSISYIDFDRKVNNLTEIYKLSGQQVTDEATITSIQQQTWDQMVRDLIMSKEYEKLGLNVSGEELFDMVQGENPHAYVRQIFTDQNTGYFDRGALIRFLKNIENDETGNQRKYWMFLENQIDEERMFTKYLNLVRKGLNVTTFQAEQNYELNSKTVDFKYLLKRYATVADSSVTISEADIKSYYDENKENYKQTASRSIEYVAFEVNPSQSDIKEAEDWINHIKPDFEIETNTEQFVNANSDIPFDPKNYKDGELPELINDFMFSSPVGSVYGPYFENETYKLAKLAAVNNLPDSVHARHILISPGPERSQERAKQIADSLTALINSGTDFALLATLNSDDKGSAQLGGDLGWFKEGAMVRPFNDASFYGNKGDVTVVESQFGYHIINIIDQGKKSKKVQVGILAREIQPSSTTFQNVYSLASKFAGTNNTYEKFIAAIEKEGLNKRVANDLKENDRQIPGLESPRLLVMAVYDTDKGNIVLDRNDQAVFELSNKYVVAYVTEVKEDGIAPLEQVREDVELNARKKKKGETIIKSINVKMADAGTIEALGDAVDAEVQSASGISFNSFSIPGAGIEPAVIGTVVELPENIISSPVEGENGVYVLMVTAINKKEDDSPESEKKALETIYLTRVNYDTYNALLEIADVKDKRSKFY
jgi:peptidyl-prolyl cis-trans isomerase D